MERVAFIVDATGDRIDCLLNPESVEIRRLAGVRPRQAAQGHLVGVGLADDPLLFTGGGRTELTLDLVFDVDLVESSVRPEDVRALTRPLWQLAENSTQERGRGRPPLVRLVWGKAWNVPGVIAAVAERFDAVGPTGVPRRSWLRLKLVRVGAAPPAGARGLDDEVALAAAAPPASGDAVAVVGDGAAGGQRAGDVAVRFDLLATTALGSPFRWRALAEHNQIANPMDVPAGTVLAVPPFRTPGG